MRMLVWVAAAAWLAGSAAPAKAGMIDESNLQPWEACALCHSLNGISRMAKFPKLAGQVPAYIMKQIGDFREGRRTNDGEQMQAMAGVIEPKNIPVVAKYFAGLPVPPPAEAPPADVIALAEPLAAKGDAKRGLPACLSCHAKGTVASSGAPRIEAQHADYISKQLTDFKAGTRTNDPDKVMEGVAGKLSDDEISALGRYFASRARE